jgi:peroxiredoxin
MLSNRLRFSLLILAAGFAFALAAPAGAGDDKAKADDKSRASGGGRPPVKGPYPELELGAKGPSFNLKNVDGKMVSLADFKEKKAVVVVFTCNACPYAKAYEDRLVSLASEYQPKGVQFVALNPNDPGKQPPDGFDKMVERAKEKKLPYPYLVDEGSTVAAAYGASVTPHIFLLDAKGTLVYRGRIDDSAKIEEVKSTDLKRALDSILSGKEISTTSTTAFGCTIKWKEKKA